MGNWGKFRLAYYIEIDMEGVDLHDAYNRAWDAEPLFDLACAGTKLLSTHGPGVAKGKIVKSRWLAGHRISEDESARYSDE